jgi:hypothetical protein
MATRRSCRRALRHAEPSFRHPHLVTQHKIKVLLYNSQTVTPITERVRTAALHAGIPVVGVTETLPPHRTFQQWQLAQTRALYRALSK